MRSLALGLALGLGCGLGCGLGPCRYLRCWFDRYRLRSCGPFRLAETFGLPTALTSTTTRCGLVQTARRGGSVRILVVDPGQSFGDLPQLPTVGIVTRPRGHLGRCHPAAGGLVDAVRPVEGTAFGLRGRCRVERGKYAFVDLLPPKRCQAPRQG